MSTGLRQALLQKGTGLERGRAYLFLTICCDFCDGVCKPHSSLSSTVYPLDHCYTGLWGHSSLQRGNFSVSPRKCSPLRSPQLGERPWHGNTHGEPQWYYQLNVSGTWQCSTFQKKKKKRNSFLWKMLFYIFFPSLCLHLLHNWTLLSSSVEEMNFICPTCSALTALSLPPWPHGFMFWTVTCSQFHNGH